MILLPSKVIILLSRSIYEISTPPNGGYDVQGVYLIRFCIYGVQIHWID